MLELMFKYDVSIDFINKGTFILIEVYRNTGYSGGINFISKIPTLRVDKRLPIDKPVELTILIEKHINKHINKHIKEWK
jgi:hypothetical protein